MMMVHLENHAITRDALRTAIGVKNSQIGGCRYFSTEYADAAEKQLQTGEVGVIVLDLGLNPGWDNQYLRKVLRHLALGTPIDDPKAPKTCIAYKLALLAHRKKARIALLTNHADYTGGKPSLTLELLAQAFRADKVFKKDNKGILACAKWVIQTLGLPAK